MEDFTIKHYTPSSQQPELINIADADEPFVPHTNVCLMYNSNDIVRFTGLQFLLLWLLLPLLLKQRALF